MKQLRNYINIIFFSIICFFGSSQITYLQEIYNGGITGDGYNQWASNQPGQFDVYIEPGSTIKRAILFASVIGEPEDRIAIFNGTPINLSALNCINDFYISNYISYTLEYRTTVVDVTNLVSPTNNLYIITPPIQNVNFNVFGAYIEFYLIILYENLSMPQINACVFANELQPQVTQSYSLFDLNYIDLSKSVGLGLHTSHFCDTIQDGSFISVDGTVIGLIGGADDNSLEPCSGISSSFYYQNEQLFGLGNDIPNTTMNGIDGIASIESYILNSTFFNVEFEYQSSLAPASNPVHQLYLAYTSPCDTFSVTTPNDTTVCEGTTLQLNASTSNPSATYEWLPSTGLSCTDCPNPIFTADSSMFYTVRIWNNDSCSVVRPVKINVRPRLTFGTITAMASECGASTGSATLLASPNNGIVTNWQEVGGITQTSNVFQNLSAGNHTFFFTDTNGCQSADTTIFIDEINSSIASFSVSPQSGVAPLSVDITNTSQNASNYEWSVNGNNEGNNLSNYTFNPSGTYVVTLVAWQFDPSCAYTAYATIIVSDRLIVPTAFTPNNDQVHDFWEIPYLDEQYPQNVVRIYNRWGNLIFESDTGKYNQQPWDGNYKGEELPVGSYYFIIQLNDENTEDIKGNVTVIRE